jgi:hypothetical protein
MAAGGAGSASLTKVDRVGCPEAEPTSLTGLASEEAQNATFAVGGLSLRGLLLAGIIIGGLRGA